MPYSGKDDPDLPSNVKSKPAKVRSQWAKVWNSAYKSCISKKKPPVTKAQRKACEGKAFKIANGVIKNRAEGGRMDGLFYIALAKLKKGKIFDALVPGTFIDMLGRKVTFKKEDLKEYVKNTKAAIAATKTEGGELVGLPIDAIDHDKGDGAGWIVGVKLESNKVRLTPKWTKIGLELIEEGIRRFFSPTVDIDNKVILGGTLTNWPATRDKKGKILLRPIELSEGDDDSLFVIDEQTELKDESLDEQVTKVRDAFYAENHPQSQVEGLPWVVDVFEEYAVIRDDGRYFSVAYKEDADGEVSFADRDDWTEVKRSWVEAMLDQVRSTLDRLTSIFSIPAEGEPEADLSNPEVISMDLTKEELQELIAGQVKEAMGAGLKDLMAELTNPSADPDAEPGEGDEPDFSILNLLQMEGLEGEFKEAVSTEMVKVYDQTKEMAAREAAKMIAAAQKDSHVGEFTVRITGGTEDVPFGIATDPDRLKKFILVQSPDDAEYIQSLFEKIVAGDGVVEFKELGSERKHTGRTPLPEYYAGKLDSKELSLPDLENEMLGLGDLSQYDLTKWREKE